MTEVKSPAKAGLFLYPQMLIKIIQTLKYSIIKIYDIVVKRPSDGLLAGKIFRLSNMLL